MRSKNIPDGQSRSFIEEARRRQIVETAIEIIASEGLSQASLSSIARHAGCSKGVISYHFQGKEDLIEAILARILREPAEFIKDRVTGHATPGAKIRAYVAANFEFMGSHRNYYVALVDLWGSRGWGESRQRFNAEIYDPSRTFLSRILASGQESGEFTGGDTATRAALIQASIDGVMLQWVHDPQAVDLQACRHEIEAMIGVHLSGGISGARPSPTGEAAASGD